MTNILSIDQGTTNSKAILVDESGRVVATGSAPVSLSLPAPGWVEQDADDIWTSVVTAISRCLSGLRRPADIEGIAISAQRESVVAWRRGSGGPVGPVLGWQDRRTDAWCAARYGAPEQTLVRDRTGLRIDAMFSAPKIAWLLTNPAAAIARGDLCVGTVDAWLIWRLTGGAVHACDAGNASRTLLYDVIDLAWSSSLLDLFDVPTEVLPQVRPSDAQFGHTSGVPGLPDGVPLIAAMADSHAALYGQGCTEVGTAKATYGTGSSVMTPTAAFVPGDSPVPTTLAWLTDRPTFAREGNILSSGATLVWTASLLGLPDVAALVRLAATTPDAAGVTFVPAFSGLGAPHWDRGAVATLAGMSQATIPAQIARAALDSVAHQICDVVEAVELDNPPITRFRADGGATAAALLMQTQADLLRRSVEVADVAEISALGSARMGWSGLGSTGWAAASAGRTYIPAEDDQQPATNRAGWRDALARARYREQTR